MAKKLRPLTDELIPGVATAKPAAAVLGRPRPAPLGTALVALGFREDMVLNNPGRWLGPVLIEAVT